MGGGEGGREEGLKIRKDRKGDTRVASFHLIMPYFIMSPGVVWCDVVFKLQCTA